jgi:dienelactone hydrolase
MIVSLTTAAAGALAGCTAQPTAEPPLPDGMPQPSASPSPTPSAALTPNAPSGTSPFASTRRSTLAPRTPVPVSVPPGAAPSTDFEVGVRTLDYARGADRPLPVTMWYPATTSAENAPVADGRFPLVLFSHGLTSQPRDYRTLLAGWARAGFVVAGAAYPHTAYGVADYQPLDVVNQPADASFLLTELLKLDTAADPLAGHLATERVAAAGHSGGGITTVGLFTGQRDERLRAGVVLAGTDLLGAPFTGPPAAMLFVHGRKDRTVAWSAGHTVFEAVPWSRAMLSITDGGHLANGGDVEAVARTTTDFLRWSLYGDAGAKSRLPRDAAVGGVATWEARL